MKNAQTNAQTTAVKVSRKFVFVLCILPKDAEFTADARCGEFRYKSGRHASAEKRMLDLLKASELTRRDYRYGIYKISTMKDSNVPDVLVETAYANGEKIIIE